MPLRFIPIALGFSAAALKSLQSSTDKFAVVVVILAAIFDTTRRSNFFIFVLFLNMFYSSEFTVAAAVAKATAACLPGRDMYRYELSIH